jgi:ATP-dependent DNA helicase
MDRCHRIGQHKPVLVLRLATAHSVEGKLLKRARSKLALERLVIKKSAFLGEGVRNHSRMTS